MRRSDPDDEVIPAKVVSPFDEFETIDIAQFAE
jgi:hypothetical protein